MRSLLSVGAQAAGTGGSCGRHTRSQGEPQPGAQGCGSGAALVQQQPASVAVNRAIRSDNARASALLRRLSAARFSGRIRSLVRDVFTVSVTATAWAPTAAAWSISSSRSRLWVLRPVGAVPLPGL